MPDLDLITVTSDGLYCSAGDFHIDPWKPVRRAVTTHAHSDHACWGCGTYLASASGAIVLRERLSAGASVQSAAFGESITMGEVRVSLHPAGHILGSAQVRVERAGEVWVVSGDYKTPVRGETPDRTSEAFDPLRCKVFITESTFGLPIYRWRPQREVFDEINQWWRSNAAAGRTSLLCAYALGKAQRVLAGVDAGLGPIGVHGAVERMNMAYAAAGVELPRAPLVSAEYAKELRGRGLVIAPPSAAGGPWVRKFAGKGGLSVAFASGWMQVRGARRRGGTGGADRGFILSDHADWDGLLATIRATGASRVGVTHGYIQPLVRWLREREGLDAFVVPTRFEGERAEEARGEAEEIGHG